MPVAPCPDCGKDVSTAAPNCPHCGRPTRRPRPWARWLQIAGAVLAIAAAPLFTISPVLCLVAALPGLALFVIGRIAAS